MSFPVWRLAVVLLFASVSVFFWHFLDGYNLRWEFTLIPLFFAVQLVLADFVEYYVLRYIGLRGRWFSIVMAPGTILHEMSHLFSAFFTGCVITDVSFFRFNPKSNVLGYVEYSQPSDNWVVFRSFLIGFAPFFVCGILLAALNLVGLGGTAVLGGFSSAESVFENITQMIGSYYNTSVNPLVLIVVAYLSICFALGSAPSMVDIKEFLRSLPRHPISALFFLGVIFTVIHMGETQLDFFGYSLSEITAFVLDVVVYVQLASIAVFVAAAPILLVSDKFVEIGVSKRVFVFSAAALVYVMLRVFYFTEDFAALCASLVFLAFLVFFRWPNIFVKSSKSASSRF